MNRQRRALQVLVCGADVRVPRLVTGYYDALGVGEVAYTRVLQAVEHVAVWPPHSLAQLGKTVAEYAWVRHLF